MDEATPLSSPCRVASWRTRIQPVVDEQDARESFDMKVCQSPDQALPHALRTCPPHMTRHLPFTNSRARNLLSYSQTRLIRGHRTLQVIMPGVYIDSQCC